MGGSLLYRSTYDRKCHIMAYRQSQVHVTGQLNPFLNEVDAGTSKTNFSMQWAWLSENVGSRRWWLSLTSRLVVGLPVVAESQNLTQLLVSNSQTKKIHKVFFFVFWFELTALYCSESWSYLQWYIHCPHQSFFSLGLRLKSWMTFVNRPPQL